MDTLRQFTASFGKPSKDKDGKEEKKEKKKGVDISEIPGDISDRFHHWRALNPKSLQDVEAKQMDQIHAIYRREIGEQLPEALEIVDKSKAFLSFQFKYKEAKRQVNDLDFDKKKWLQLMKDNDGPFKFQAEELVKIICRFQTIKAKRHVSKGFYTDPENLWCEETKMWATNSLSLMDVSIGTRDLIYKRIRYFEEILCEDNLFDRPSSRVTHTVQQVVVASRAVLKYHTVPVIDKELAHHDARRAFDSLKKHLIILISDSVEFLFNVYRSPAKKGVQDTATKLLSILLDDEFIAKAFPDSQKEVRARVLGIPEEFDKQKDKQTGFLKMGRGVDLYLSENVLIDSVPQGGPPLATNKEPISDAQLARIFVGDKCGFELRFRANHFVARQYLRAHALVLELGQLYDVIDKAAACASQGGTLLVYGLANAQLNAMLDTTEKLLQSLRDSLNMCAQIAEVRFEELVYSNEATTSRTPWIAHFKLVHSTLAKIDKMNNTLVQEIALIKVQANSMTLYEQFQKAQQDTDTFLTSASDFSKHMSDVLGIPYNKPKSPPIVSLPDPSAFSVDEADVKKGLPAPNSGSATLDLSRLAGAIQVQASF